MKELTMDDIPVIPVTREQLKDYLEYLPEDTQLIIEWGDEEDDD